MGRRLFRFGSDIVLSVDDNEFTDNNSCVNIMQEDEEGDHVVHICTERWNDFVKIIREVDVHMQATIDPSCLGPTSM